MNTTDLYRIQSDLWLYGKLPLSEFNRMTIKEILFFHKRLIEKLEADAKARG
jgi:hypothetical protein